MLTVLPVQAAGVERLSLAGLGPPPRLAGNSLNILLTIDLLPPAYLRVTAEHLEGLHVGQLCPGDSTKSEF